MVKVAASVLPEVNFFDTDDACFARGYDLVSASGSMHYARDWRALLARLAQAASPCLYVTRLPIVPRAASYVFVQRVRGLGYDTEYQGWCLNREEFLPRIDLRTTLERALLGHPSAQAA